VSSWSWYPPPSRRRPVEAGLKAKSKRGQIGITWWSTRFIEVLEAYGLGGRMTRGRTYARQGQVIDLEVTPGVVTAHVQGSRKKPYKVRIGLRAFGKAEWLEVADEMASNAWYAAKLLSGEMPTDIESLFAAVGLSLFPEDIDELDMDCTCPDWEVPCKHIAAAFYLLAEAFDEDPFLILAWRGRDRGSLMSMVASKRTGGVDLADNAPELSLSDRVGDYFAAGALTLPLSLGQAEVTALDQLPELDVTVGGQPLVEVLRPVYQAMTRSPR